MRPLLALALAAALTVMIYALIFARLAYLPELYNIPAVTMHWLDKGRGLARAELILAFAALGVLYFAGWRAARRAEGPAAWLIVVIAGLASGAALLLMYPFGAADIFDNILHARIYAVYGANPFVDVINQFPRDPFVPYTAWRFSPSAYGPLWELAAGLAARLAGDSILLNILAFKLLPALFWLLTLLVAAVLLQRTGRKPALPAFLLLAWNPMILYEVWGNGHNDMMMAFFILLAAWLIFEKRYTLAVLSLTAGTLVKYMPVLLIPAAGLIALRALPNNRRRAAFILSSAVLAGAMIVISFAPFWVGPDTLTIGRRAEMLSGSPAAAIFSVLTEALKFDKTQTATAISLVLLVLTDGFAIWQGFRAMRKPDWRSFVVHSFIILMFYLLVTVPWFQQWYAIWPMVLVPFLPPLARNMALVFSFAVLGKQLWVDPMLYWGRTWSPLPSREIAFAIGNLIFAWLYAAYALNQVRLRRFASPRRESRQPAAPMLGRAVPVTGEDGSEGESAGD